MSYTSLAQPGTNEKVASQPTLLRTTPDRPSLREAIAGQIRNECGANRWTCIELAEILNVSVDRARHLYAGRRPLLLDELEALCIAADIPLLKFMDDATERRDTFRVFADTTMAEIAEMASEAGTTPDRLLRSRGWTRRDKADVPAHLGGDA